MDSSDEDKSDGPAAPRRAGRQAPTGQDFAGKRVLISGGTSGIGRAAALALAARGARVVIAGRDAARGEEVLAALRAHDPAAQFLACDLGAPEAAAEMVTTAATRLGGLDIAFNNAGYQEPRGLLGEQPDACFDQVFTVNLRALFQAMKAQVRLMLDQGGGVIVNTASVSGLRNPNPGFALYSASKAAVISLTRSAAMEYAAQGLRINALSPGRIVTPMMLGAKLADPETVGRSLPIRRMGRPEEVADALLWLASDAAAFVVGQNICVDGGFLAA